MNTIVFAWFVVSVAVGIWNIIRTSQDLIQVGVSIAWIGPVLILAYLVALTSYLFKISVGQEKRPEDRFEQLRCKELEQQKGHVLDLADQISRSYGISPPTILVSPVVRNNAFSISGKGRNFIVLAEDFLEKLTSPQIELILRHEMYHLKYFTINKFEFLARQPYLYGTGNLLVLFVIPFFAITLFNDAIMGTYVSPTYFLLHGALACLFLTMAYLIFLIYLFFSHTRPPAAHSRNLSELLSDAFSVLERKNFEEMKSVVKALSPPKEDSLLIGIHECFISKVSSNKIRLTREEVQKRREEDNEDSGILHDLMSHHWVYDKNNPNNWVDIIHQDAGTSDIYYDEDVRLEFLNDLQEMCENHVQISTTSKTRKRLGFIGGHDTLQGDVGLIGLWKYLFQIHAIPSDVLRSVFEYVEKNGNTFNLPECAKYAHQSEFTTFLAMLRHILHRNIVIKWRYPSKFNFDY